MKTIRVLGGVLLLLLETAPADADFQYTETSQVTGGSLVKMMRVATMFSRGDAKKQAQQALQPTTTTRYVKGNRLRVDNPDGTAQIIDLEGRRVIEINLNQKTYAVATFDQIQAAIEQAQQKTQQQAAQNPQEKQELQNTQLKITPTIHVTPGAANRVILNQPTNETKVQMDLAMQAVATGANAPPPGQANPGTATYSMYMDTFVAPNVTGYQEFAEFYRQMAQDVGWMKLPAMNIQIDPRMAEGMSELQKNSDALRGFPMLSYVSMALTATPNGQNGSSENAQNQQPSNSSGSNSNPSSDDTVPTSSSEAMMKGLGGLFGRKKPHDDSNSNQAGGLPPNPDSNPNALMEITTQVSSFSTNSLDASLFDIPAGYTQIEEDPSLVLGGRSPQQQTPGK